MEERYRKIENKNLSINRKSGLVERHTDINSTYIKMVAPTPAAVWAADRAEAEAAAAAEAEAAAAAEAERARAEAEEHDLYVRGRARWRAERAREEAERARAAEAERARVEAGRAARQVAGKCVNTLIPLIKPSLSPPPPDVPMNPPPGEPNDDSDKSNSSTGTGGLVGTALTAGKNAVLFVITHPVTPYAVGAAVGVGVCYYGYKWFTSGNSESDGKEEEATEEIEKPKT